MRTRITMLWIALAASPLAAQDTITIGSGGKPRTDVAPMKVKPGIDIKASPVIRRERKAVIDWPDRHIDFAMPPEWSNPVRRIAANYPPSALAVERVYSPSTVDCITFYDRIDLTLPRKRGFRLVGFDAEPLTPRFGYSPQSPVEAIAVDSSQGDRYTAFLDKADQIRIRPPLFGKREGTLYGCWSGYRITVTLEGPPGVDPFGPTFPRPPHR